MAKHGDAIRAIDSAIFEAMLAGERDRWSAVKRDLTEARAAFEKLIEAANACALSLTPADDSDNDGLYVVRARYVHELRAALRAVSGGVSNG